MKIIKDVSENFKGSAKLFEHNGEYFIASNAITLDHGNETMIFRSDENGNVESYTDLFCAREENEDCVELIHCITSFCNHKSKTKIQNEKH